METEDDSELTVEVDEDGYRIDHRSETELTSQTKEVHEFPDRTEIRLRDEKEVKLEEIKSKETTRPATYDEILALLEAEFEGLEEVQSREVTAEEFNSCETTREVVKDGELQREIRITDERKKEEIIESPSDSKKEVITETETTVINPFSCELTLKEPELPNSPYSQDTEVAVEDTSKKTSKAPDLEVQPSSTAMQPGLSVQPKGGSGGGVIVNVSPADGLSEQAERQAIWIPKNAGKENLGVHGEVNFAETTGSLHKIHHQKHVLEELIVEDVDTFYEDQSKSAGKRPALFAKQARKKQTPSTSASLEKRRSKTDPAKQPIADYELITNVETVTPKPSPTQPQAVCIEGPSRAEVPQGDVAIVTEIPRNVLVDAEETPTGTDGSVTYVVTYDFPPVITAKEARRRKTEMHPKKKKSKRKTDKNIPHLDGAQDAFSVTYIVNHEPSLPFDGDEPAEKTEGKLPRPFIPKETHAQENVTIEVDMEAGEVKVTEPNDKPEENKRFVVDYEVSQTAGKKHDKLEKPKPEVRGELLTLDSGKPRPHSEEITYVINYDLPSDTTDAPKKSLTLPLKSSEADMNPKKPAPSYSVTVDEHTSDDERPKQRQQTLEDNILEMTYVVNYAEPEEKAKKKKPIESAEVGWIRPPSAEISIETKKKKVPTATLR